MTTMLREKGCKTGAIMRGGAFAQHKHGQNAQHISCWILRLENEKMGMIMRVHEQDSMYRPSHALLSITLPAVWVVPRLSMAGRTRV